MDDARLIHMETCSQGGYMKTCMQTMHNAIQTVPCHCMAESARGGKEGREGRANEGLGGKGLLITTILIN